jgi:hypothetical protein
VPGSDITTAAAAYLVFTLLAIVGPALGLLRLARLANDPALVIPLGLALCAASYWLSLVSGWPWLFVVVVTALNLAFLRGVRQLRIAQGPSLRGALAPLAAIVVLFGLTQYRLNRVDADGTFLLDNAERIDTAFHVAVTWELTDEYPPQVPGLSGVPLRYHVGSHLVRAAAVRWAGVHPYDALYRFDITLWALALLLALRGAAQAIGLSPLAVTLVGFTPLLTDFSFLLALLPDTRWWTAALAGNLLHSLFFANSAIPALAIALALLTALARHRAEGGRGWLVIATLLALALPLFKVFLAAQALAGLGVAWLVGRRERFLLPPLVACLSVLTLLALGQGAGGFGVFLEPGALVRQVVVALGLPAPGAALLFWSGAWLAAALGVRLLGIPLAWTALQGAEPVRAALAAMALIGWPLALVLRISADGQYNESVYFVEHSGALLWVFTAEAVARHLKHSARPWLLACACLALATPAAVEFVGRKALRPDVDPVPASKVRAMQSLAAQSRRGDVVLMRPATQYPPPPVVFIGRRVAFTTYIPYRRQFADAAFLAERERLVRRFFRSESTAAALGIAELLDARFLYLTDRQKIDWDPRGVLIPIHQEGDERVYRIVRQR